MDSNQSIARENKSEDIINTSYSINCSCFWCGVSGLLSRDSCIAKREKKSEQSIFIWGSWQRLLGAKESCNYTSGK